MKNIKILMLLLWACFSSFLADAQNCGTMALAEIQEKHPEYAAKLERIEAFTQEWIRTTDERSVNQIITIPIVFHVIHSGIVTTENNIPDAYLMAQLLQLNDDFRRMNGNANNLWLQADDMEIEFCLANLDPDGNPTSGIIRHYNARESWNISDFDDIIKPATIWDPNSYLNFWIAPDLGETLWGYSSFPGMDPTMDGIVVAARHIGGLDFPNPAPQGLSPDKNRGRVATHEVGHWLNLRHIWGDAPCGSDDLVDDTPESDEANYGCEIGHESCGTTDMVQNYMDYSNDGCISLFTTGQKNRMRATLMGPRASILTSTGCSGTIPVPTCTDENITVIDTYNSGDNVELVAEDWIVSTATVNAGADVTHYAGNYVYMNPGFIADKGSVFISAISPCYTPVNELVQNETDQVQEFSKINLHRFEESATEQFAVKSFPNPFTGKTTIEFFLEQDTPVSLVISDATGKQLVSLLQQEYKTGGTHQVIFDANEYPSGLYYYTIQAGNHLTTQKMILMR